MVGFCFLLSFLSNPLEVAGGEGEMRKWREQGGKPGEEKAGAEEMPLLRVIIWEGRCGEEGKGEVKVPSFGVEV